MENRTFSFHPGNSSFSSNRFHPPVIHKCRRFSTISSCLSPACGERLPLLALSSMLLFLLLCLLLLNLTGNRLHQEVLSRSIAPQILRIHVIANSDSAEDQAVKLEVKEALLSYIQEDIPEAFMDTQKNTQADSSDPTASSFPYASNHSSSSDSDASAKLLLCTYIQAHREQLKQRAEEILRTRGFSYPVSIELGPYYFSTRTYEDTAFPCGVYDSVRILLGEARGHNWWGILYPPLAFPGSVVPETDAKNQSAGSVSDALIFDNDMNWLSQKKHIFFDMSRKDTTLISSKAALITCSNHSEFSGTASASKTTTEPAASSSSSKASSTHAISADSHLPDKAHVSSDHSITLRVTCRFLSFLPGGSE